MEPHSPNAAVVRRLKVLEPRISRILTITGIPGCSIGVVHQGVEIWKFNVGHRDVENKQPPRSGTSFHLNSLTKGLTAAAFACLVHEGKISWDTPIRSAGTRPSDQCFPTLAKEGNNIVLPSKADTVRLWNATPRMGAFRSDFNYNNWSYGVIALVIEKLSSKPFGVFLQEQFFDPLRLTRTKMNNHVPDSNSAVSYATLDDRSPVRVPEPAISTGTFAEGGTGVISTIDDMLHLYKAYLKAINDQFRRKSRSTLDNPFVECTTLLAPHILLPEAEGVLREQSYACGWVRCQLPGPLGMIGMNPQTMRVPDVLEGGQPRLCFYHLGTMVGSSSDVALFPETDTVIAILANAAPLGDGCDWILQMITEAIFDPPVRHPYEDLAETKAQHILHHIPSLSRQLEARKKPGTKPCSPIEAYAGRFVHDKSLLEIEIRQNDNEKDGLTLTFHRQEAETYPLHHFECDTFSWWMPFNEASRRGRGLTGYEADSCLVHFKGPDCFTWISGDIGKEPYVFKRP